MFSPSSEMNIREFFEKVNHDEIPDNLNEAGESSFGDGITNGIIYRYKDEKTGTIYKFYIYSNNFIKFSIKELALLYKKQPVLMSTLMSQHSLFKNSSSFLDAMYSELKDLLGEDKIFPFFNKIPSYLCPELKLICMKNFMQTISDLKNLELPDFAAINSIATDFNKMAEYEGYWSKPWYFNEYIAQISAQMFAINDANHLNSSQLQVLHDLIMEKEYGGSAKKNLPDIPSYPLPHANKWPQQDKILKILEFLGNFAIKMDNYRSFDYTIVPQHIRDNLLLFRIRKMGFGGMEWTRLSYPQHETRGTYEFALSLPDGTELKWTEGLPKYIKYYNVIPSKEFLSKLSQLKPLFETHQCAYNELLQYIESPPPRLGL